MSRHRSRGAEALSPLLVRLIEAAEHSGEDAEGRDVKAAANALRELGALALWAVPIHGVFVPNKDRVSAIIDQVAQQRLGMEEGRREWKEALHAVEAFAQRDAIESAHNHSRAVSEEAYFYAGLAFGLTLADYPAPRGVARTARLARPARRAVLPPRRRR